MSYLARQAWQRGASCRDGRRGRWPSTGRTGPGGGAGEGTRTAHGPGSQPLPSHVSCGSGLV